MSQEQERERVLRYIIDGLFGIAAPGNIKDSLWRAYQNTLEPEQPMGNLEQQIIADFQKYEGITIARLDEKRVKATYQEFFGEGSATGDSVLNVLIHAVRAQKNYEYWRGYHAREEKEKEDLAERLDQYSEQLDQLTESIALLRETTETAIKHLASHVSHLALQFKLDHQQQEQEHQ